eukprot:NODE_3117_length_1044_cov_31.857286_g2864_i0.p1 GENE.NODE_3117_length_1044_cov_31.857286_g2864_i0~~NODE_3117_length_1044_cov_31.857286_g2864_i0.p1  ORF type:complete len:232 (+),score=18.57 NODE_3117_length_1044_cov_31.857286_g2864_i0:133-828(+)
MELVAQPTSRQLQDFISIVVDCLPGMCCTHVARLVTSRQHSSVVAVDEKGCVSGGVTFWTAAQFVEISLLCVKREVQRQGLGSKLVRHLREKVAANRIGHIITFADDTAIPFFGSHGFRKQSETHWPWLHMVRSYRNATPMECWLEMEPSSVRSRRTTTSGASCRSCSNKNSPWMVRCDGCGGWYHWPECQRYDPLHEPEAAWFCSSCAPLPRDEVRSPMTTRKRLVSEIS